MSGGEDHIDAIVVYDDDEAERRRLVVEKVLASLSEHSPIPRDIRVVPASLRHECVAAVEATMRRGRRAVLLADLMTPDGSPKGARLLRAASTDPAIRAATIRIALTRRTSPNVARELTGFAHALVVWQSDSAVPGVPAGLAEALSEAWSLASNEPPEPIPVYPAGATGNYTQELERVLMWALEAPYQKATPQKRAELARVAFRIAESPLRNMPLEHPEGGPAFDVPLDPKKTVDDTMTATAFFREMRKHDKIKRRSNETIIRELSRLLRWVSSSRIDERITPRTLNSACVHDAMNYLQNDERRWRPLWLTPDEGRLALLFLAAAVEAMAGYTDRFMPHGETSSYKRLNKLFEATDYDAFRSANKFSHWDTCYAVWTIADWLDDLDKVPGERSRALRRAPIRPGEQP